MPQVPDKLEIVQLCCKNGKIYVSLIQRIYKVSYRRACIWRDEIEKGNKDESTQRA